MNRDEACAYCRAPIEVGEPVSMILHDPRGSTLRPYHDRCVARRKASERREGLARRSAYRGGRVSPR